MDIYIYAQSGHNFGLENVRRCSALYKKPLNQTYILPSKQVYHINKDNLILATSDFRASTFAKQYLGVYKSVGVDIIQNLPNLMQRGDVLIYDSNEVSPKLKNSMKEFCNEVFAIGQEINEILVDDNYLQTFNIKREYGFFYGDDDYNDTIFDILDQYYDIDFLLGHYFFLGNEKKLKKYFHTIYEDEDYFDFITTTKYLITSSIQAALESFYSGNKPIFLPRKDKLYNLEQLQQLSIPIISHLNEIRFDK